MLWCNKEVNLWACTINLILIQVYPRKRGWPDLPHSNSNLSNSHSPSRSIQGILFLQTNILALLLLLRLSRLLWSSSLPLALHFKFQRFSQNVPIIPPQHMPAPSHSICLCHLNHCFLYTCGEVVGGSGKGLYRVIGWNSGPFLDEKVRH